MGNNVSYATVYNCAELYNGVDGSLQDGFTALTFDGHDTRSVASRMAVIGGVSELDTYGDSFSTHCECDDCWYCQLDFEIYSKRGGCIIEFNYWLDNVPHNNHVVITNDDTTNGYNLELYDTFSSCEALLLN